ncbi:MAG: AAA family ATPase [Coriobacteriales bacterium]
MASRIITISRQYGSGGREVGERLAEKLGYTYYDKEVIRRAVEESDISEEIFEKGDESAGSMFSYLLSFANGQGGQEESLPLPDRIFLIQSKVIKKLAAEGPCVIIGRSADYVLRDSPDLLRVLIYADKKARVERVMKRNNLTEKGALARIKKIDKGRALYYEQFTGNKWCDVFQHDVAISTSRFSIEDTVEILANIAKNS